MLVKKDEKRNISYLYSTQFHKINLGAAEAKKSVARWNRNYMTAENREPREEVVVEGGSGKKRKKLKTKGSNKNNWRKKKKLKKFKSTFNIHC